MSFLWGLLIAAGAVVPVGCIDDRPSGPGRIRDSGGSISESSSANGGSGGATASGGTSSHSQSAGSSGRVSSGGEAGSVASSSASRGGTSSSQSGSSGGAAGGGGATPSSQAGGAGQGGSSQSSLAASSGGSGGSVSTASSSVNRDAGVLPRDASAPADAAGVVSFANQILPMLKSNCTSCHGSSRQNAGVRLDSYTVVKTNLSKASNVISRGTMPPTGGLKTDLRQLFQTWVDQGALDN